MLRMILSDMDRWCTSHLLFKHNRFIGSISVVRGLHNSVYVCACIAYTMELKDCESITAAIKWLDKEAEKYAC